MNRRLFTIISGILLLFSGLLLFLVESDDFSQVRHRHITGLSQMVIIHESLAESVLQVNNRAYTHYDKVSETSRQLREKHAQLLADMKSNATSNTEPFYQRLSSLTSLLEKELELIEDFKTHNAIAHNAIIYLPRITEISLASIPASMGYERQVLNKLNAQTIHAHLLKANDQYAHVNILLTDFENSLESINDEAAKEQIIKFCAHNRVVLESSRLALSALTSYERIEDEIDDILEEILSDYSNYNQGTHETLESYKNVLAWFTILAMVIIILVLYRNTKAHETLEKEKERAQVTLQSIGDGVITTDNNGDITYLNPVAERLTGWTIADAINRPLSEIFRIVHEVSRKTIANPVERCLENDTVIHLSSHSILISRDEKEVAIEDSAAPIRDNEGKIIGVVLVFHDISEQNILKQELSWQATHDALTGLINRFEFERRVEHAMTTSRTDGRNHGLLYIDLDQFKVVNDTAGHIAGDKVLRQVAGIFNNIVRDTDTLARMGGDEFGLLLQDCPADKALEIANQIISALSDYRFWWEDREYTVGASIGLATIDHSSESLQQVFSAADLACYAAKDAGRNRAHQYHDRDEHTISHRSKMEQVSVIRNALTNNLFVLFAQPVFAITGEQVTAGYEILIRMRDHDGNMVLPHQFLPAAEHFDMMGEIDRWVVDNTFKTLREKASTGVHYFINLSGQSLGNNELLHYIKQKLLEYQLDPGEIGFEITETAIVSNYMNAQRMIEELAKIGCHFALDDFGTGLSSYAYLRHLRVDHLKIDGSFVREMTKDPVSNAIVRSICELAKSLEIKTITEMVEDRETLQALKAIGVDYAQGHYLAKPSEFT